MRFDSWNLQMDTFPVRQYDNLPRRLEVSGDIPEGWSWAVLLSIGDNLNIISLQYGGPGLYVDLTADMIPYAGKYNLQLRATQGDKVRHTNIVSLTVNESMSGDVRWPELPSEFSQAEQRLEELNDNPPIPGDNGFWLTWNVETDRYEESDKPLPDISVGPAGPAATVEVAETITGAPGSDASVENLGTENAALLRFTIPSGPAGPAGTTPQISVTVTTLPAGQDVTVQVSGPAEAPTIAFGIPQGQPGERGPQGLQGIQGWGLSGAELDEDGALVLTIRNPADGQTMTLPPVAIDNSAALQAVAAAISAQGTTQVQRVEEAGDTAVGAVSTAKDAAQEQPEQPPTVETQAVTFSRVMARTMTTISDADALTMPDILPTWQSYLVAGQQIPAGVCVMHNGQCYRQVQSSAVTPQAHQPPDAAGMLAVYRPIERQHTGTQADPIPWVYGMDCYEGKYYSHNGSIYRVATGGTMAPCVWEPGTAGLWQWELIS